MGVINLLQHRYKKSSISHSLRKALSNGEIKVFYQPKIEAGSTRVVGAEAQRRWYAGRSRTAHLFILICLFLLLRRTEV